MSNYYMYVGYPCGKQVETDTQEMVKYPLLGMPHGSTPPYHTIHTPQELIWFTYSIFRNAHTNKTKHNIGHTTH